jgi:hypothetical protein
MNALSATGIHKLPIHGARAVTFFAYWTCPSRSSDRGQQGIAITQPPAFMRFYYAQ